MRGSSTSGVLPIRSSSELASTAARHGGQEDDRRTVAHGRLEPVARADVLAVDVHVDERRQLAVLVDARAESRHTHREVLEELTHRGAARLDLPRAARLRAQNRRNTNETHLAQNST